MEIDIATLFLLVVMLCLVVGSLFLSSGFRDRGERQSLRAGAGMWLIAVGVGLVLARGSVPDWLSIVVANTALLTAFGLFWSIARIFERRSAPWPLVLAGSAIWLAACAVPAFYAQLSWRISFISFAAAFYSTAAGLEFWRGRGEKLQARPPLVALCFFHALVVSARGVTTFLVPPIGPLEGGSLQNILMLEAPVALFAAAFLCVGLFRERAELDLRRSAEVDELTGVLNRRAFLARGERLVEEARRSKSPVVLILFDLDHFKAINDRHGHAAGDRTLRVFAEAASRAIRTTDVFARIGGEEFAALLPGCDTVTARRIAERIRLDFSARTAEELGDRSPATASAGVATWSAGAGGIEVLMAEADAALYRSKREGRDRVTGGLADVG